MRLLVIVCFLEGLVGAVSSQSACDVDNIEACILPLDQYNIHRDILFPQFKRGELQELCDDYKTVESCLQPIKPACSLYRRRHYEGVEQAYDYICGTGFEIYLENYYCWGNEDLRKDVRQCNATYQASLRDTMLNAYIYTNLEMNERMCQHINDYVFCIKDTVKDMCNSSSANWQHEVNLKSLSPVLAEMNCTIGRPVLNAGEIAGIVIGCVVFLVVVILVIYYFTCNVDKYRKKQKLYINEAQQKPKSNPSVRPAPQGPAPQRTAMSRPIAASAPPEEVTKRSSLKKSRTQSNSGRLNLSFADDIPSVRSGGDTYQSLPSYTQVMGNDHSVISDRSFQQESADWEEEEERHRRRPKDVPRLF